MAFKRTAIPFFELANAAYASSTVTFFGVSDTDNSRLSTTITLYSAKTGSTTVSNPYTLDSDGKFSSPVYAEARTIAVVEDVDGNEHSTGIWEPALSTADVTAAAASATAAAASAASAAADVTTSAGYATAAAASAALAAASVGTVYAGATDTTTARLIGKVTAVAPVTIVDATTAVQFGVTVATNAQALAKASSAVVLVPSNLAALNADAVTTGLVRFATLAEVTTGTVSTAAVTPEGLTTALGNTVTKVNALSGAYTAVTAGANVTMTANSVYRFTATVAANVVFPTTVATNEIYIVEFACTTGATMSVSTGGHTVNGVTAAEQCTIYGPRIHYHVVSSGVIRGFLAGRVAG